MGFPVKNFRCPKEKLRTEFRSRYGLDGRFVVGCVGRIKWVRKGQEFLVRATALLKQQGHPITSVDCRHAVSGKRKPLNPAPELVEELGVQDQIIFTGELADPRPAYAGMDVLTLTSAQPEPFGNVVMEAMGMGLPVIATNIGGSLDQVLDGVTGFLVPPADPAALAAAIQKLMSNSELRRRMGEAAASRVQERFSITEMTAKIEAIIGEALRRQSNSPRTGC